MFTRFDASKSTKGASKLRRDLINAEIANLRDLLPLPPSTRQRLSQLQLMALVCVYVRKANYFQQVFKRTDLSLHHHHHHLHHQLHQPISTPNIGFSKALSGFLMMMTQNGKLLYISDNAAEYLGHSMEDLLIHGDSVYDMIDKQDHHAIQTELGRSQNNAEDDFRIFLCRMNVSRNARRQMRFGDQKVVLVQGHYLSFLPLCSRNEPVFLATCTPVAMPETRECVVQGATNVFTSIHSMDMKFMHIDKNGEFHLGFPKTDLQGASWYHFLHWDCLREAQSKHRLITQSDQDRSCILLIRLQRREGGWLWVHCVLQVKDNMENCQQPVIVSTNQVLSEREATVMRSNTWLYHYYMIQSKLQYGLHYDAHSATRLPAASYYQHPVPYQDQASMPMFHPVHSTAHPHPHHQSFHSNDTIHVYSRRNEPEPVDYSLHSSQDASPPPAPVRTSPIKQEKSLLTIVPKLELSPQSSASSEVIVDLDRTGHDGGGGTLFLTTSSTSLGRSRIFVKAATATMDPAEFMDQWNPSPPWSDTTVQKVPDILHHDLSPYVTTTPPTPNSSSCHPLHSAFTFDWAPEQYVPNMHSLTRTPSLEDETSHHISCPPWLASSEHTLFPLQPPPSIRPSMIVRTAAMEVDQVDSQCSKSSKDGRDSVSTESGNGS